MSSTSRIRLPARIEKIILFNSAWDQREGEEVKKLIFYYNGVNDKVNDTTNWEMNGGVDEALNQGLSFDYDEENTRDAVNAMGLCEAMINFVKNFGSQEGIR